MLPINRDQVLVDIRSTLRSTTDFLVCVSARAAFDLYLQASDWREGDEIVFSGLTIAAMPELAIRRGLHVLPLDIDPDSGVPAHQELLTIVTPRTKAIVVVHLFGARFDLTDLIHEAKKHNLVIIEDCAQAYDGPHWHGHPDADMSLFSFGSTKSATALGGALAFIRRPNLFASMNALQSNYPLRSRITYLGRVLKYGIVMLSTVPMIYRFLHILMIALRLDSEKLIHALSRSPSTDKANSQFLEQPSSPLLKLLWMRLFEGDSPLTIRRSHARKLLCYLESEQLIPTSQHERHNFWIVPFRADLVNLTRIDFSNAGVEVISTRLVPLVGLSEDSGAHQLARVVLLPFDVAMSDSQLAEIGSRVKQLAIKATSVDTVRNGQVLLPDVQEASVSSMEFYRNLHN